jgi:hypothetical protein
MLLHVPLLLFDVLQKLLDGFAVGLKLLAFWDYNAFRNFAKFDSFAVLLWNWGVDLGVGTRLQLLALHHFVDSAP